MSRALALLLSLIVASNAIAKDRDRPNIIVILADDVGYCDLGCYGSEIHTPNLDALANNGLRFTQFYNTARCCPSRAALLSGLYSHQAGVGHMVEDKGLDGFVGDLNRTCVTIPEVLRPAGYGTYMLGKWHVTKQITANGPKDNWPVARGFDRYYGTILGAGNFFDPGGLTRDATMISPFVDPQYQPPAGEPFYYTNALSDQACRFISEHERDHGDKPFFMYVAYTAAHWPMQALPADIEKYKGVYDVGYEPIRRARFERMKKMGLIDPQWELSPQFGEWDKVTNKAWEARCMEVYAAMLTCMDRGVGRIVDTLKQNGQLDNTLILYMQDNGGNLEDVGRHGNATRADHPTLAKIPPEFVQPSGQPKQTRDGYPVLQGEGVLPGPADTFIAYGKAWANVSNTPFREYKHYVHEGGIATPLVAHWPKGITRRGDLERQPGHLIDVMATCVDLAKATYPKEFAGQPITPLEGKSLVPAFAGKPIARKALYWEHEGNRAVRQGDWKLVAKGPAAPWELYNLSTDRTEMHDLSSSSPDKARELQTLWEAWAKRAHVLPWPWKPQYGTKTDGAKPGEPLTLTLKPNADLSGNNAPDVVGKSIEIHATLTKLGDGVIIAQGGTAAGFSLYIKDGRLTFATRHANKLTTVATPDALPPTTRELTATMTKDGAVTLTADGKPAATGKTPGPLTKQPVDGLQVGRDLKGAVGDYTAPFDFKGNLTDVKVDLKP